MQDARCKMQDARCKMPGCKSKRRWECPKCACGTQVIETILSHYISDICYSYNQPNDIVL